MNRLSIFLNGALIVILSGVMIAAFGVQIFLQEEPCPLCLLQRLGMTGVAIGALMNLRFGIKTKHYAVCIFSAIFGSLVALRQTALHICPGDPTFGTPIFGLDLWIWSFIVFICAIAYIGILLFLVPSEEDNQFCPKMNAFSIFTAWLIAIVTIANILTALHLCGLGFCMD